MKASRFSLTVLLVESVAIFCSVLLAFAAEQWREDINDSKRTREALNLIKAELELNLDELEAVVGTREKMLSNYIEALGTLVDTGTYPTDIEGFTIPDITNLAYQLATDSGAVTSVDPQDLLVIARAYEALDNVRANEQFLNTRNAQIRYQDGEQYLSGFIYYANRSLTAEPEAIAALERAIETLD